MTTINFINKLSNNNSVQTIKEIDNNSFRIDYKDNSYEIFVFDIEGRIIFHNINNELITKTEYSDSGNVIKKIEFTENGYEITDYEDSPIIKPIKIENNGVVTICSNSIAC